MPEPSSREMETRGGLSSLLISQVSADDDLLQTQDPHNNNSSHDDFLDQILSTFPNCSWPPQQQQQHPPSSAPNAGIVSGGDSLLGDVGAAFPCSIDNAQGGEAGSFQALYGGFGGSISSNGCPPPTTLQQFNPPNASVSAGGKGGCTPPQRQRVRARRGQATDPHSIAERIRRERIAERMKGLQELVPNGNKTDKASMLDEIIDYVKFLQLQVKVLSMSRLGGTAVPPQVADVSAEGGGGEGGHASNGNSSNDNMTMTEHQVAKLMDEDLGSAMQYLQRKGLCLMPISLATAISTATCQPRNLNSHSLAPSNAVEPTPNVSGLTVQSTTKNTVNNSSMQ